MNIDAALQITTGFMSVHELFWLATHAAQHKRIIEVGSWTGRSTRALTDNTSGTVYAIDTFAGSEDGDLKDILEAHGGEWAWSEFQKNTSEVENLRAYRMDSMSAATMLTPFDPFDMIFIDGCHSYEAVKADILAWLPRLSVNGLICGHDYTLTRPHCLGVKQAVDEIFGDKVFTMSPDDGEHTIWWKYPR